MAGTTRGKRAVWSRRAATAFLRWLSRSELAEFARAERLVAAATNIEPEMRQLTDRDFRAAVDEVRSSWTGPGRDHERWLVRYLAMAREASIRGLGLRPFDVQLLGAERMLAGGIADMDTGEGKTLAGAIAAGGFVLQGHAVHVMSVNDYLAQRDAEWMAPLYALLDASVEWIGSASTTEQRRMAYGADITYGAVSEIGFDVLRDRGVTEIVERVSPRHDIALVDEADSVLIDEAQVPLVLAGAAEGVPPTVRITEVVRGLRPGEHFRSDEDRRSVWLTEQGVQAVEKALGTHLYSTIGSNTLAQVNQALHAEALLDRDVHYIVADGRVQLINENRGRVARLQRWPDGLHAAVEAKEGLVPTEPGEILDSTTVHAVVEAYGAVCGMTGTAIAARDQFESLHGLRVWRIPRQLPCRRTDEPDRAYATVDAKEVALAEFVRSTHRRGQPVLIGSQDVAESERLATRLAGLGVECTVLNAKNDAEEAAIVAEAGRSGAVTVSTQMAGRGTDIRLGGSDAEDHDRVMARGGLCVVGCGRHSTERLDIQLRGRAGRQGDPGRSVFFVSPQDDLVQTYAPSMDPVASVGEDGRITYKRAWSLFGHAQRVAEAAMLEIHRTTYQYNRVIQYQRRLLDDYRERILQTDQGLRDLENRCRRRLAELRGAGAIEPRLVEAARLIMLHQLDRCWVEHLAFLSELREAIHFRVLAKQVPIVEFNREALEAFGAFRKNVVERSATTFDSAPITGDRFDPELAGLKRPNATWTYMVQENPFGTEGERLVRALVRPFRRHRR